MLKVGSLFRVAKVTTGCNLEGYGAGSAAIAAATVHLKNGTPEQMEKAMVLAMSPTIGVPCTPRVLVPALCTAHVGGAILGGMYAGRLCTTVEMTVNVPFDVMFAMASLVHKESAHHIVPTVVEYMEPFFQRTAEVESLVSEEVHKADKKRIEETLEKAKEIALSLELFTTGSLDIFGHESTVDLDKRIVVFDIHGLGEQLKPTGLLVITDTILNRVTLNWKKGKRTHIFIDEFHVVFENEQSGIFFNSAWRQFRKRNGYPTAITQNVEYLLDSVQASTMLSNSEFVVMLNQAFSDRAKLSKLLNISDEQMSYVTNADAGCGLIKYGSALVPFINRFPKDTELYRLMTTRPGEGVFGSGNAS